MRVLHVAVGFAEYEGIGRSIAEVTARLPAVESFLCTERLRAGGDGFRSVVETGGSPSFFQFTRWSRVSSAINQVKPHIVHLHGGILTPLLAHSPAFSASRVVVSIYRWPRLPSLAELRVANLVELRDRELVPPRVFLSELLSQKRVGQVLSSGRIRGVVTHDPLLATKLRQLSATPVCLAEGGGSVVDGIQASYDPDRPIIAFAGRAEISRGIETLVASMPAVLHNVSGAELHLLLLPSPPTRVIRRLRELAVSLGVRDHVKVRIERMPDVRAAFAKCTLAAFPFNFDHTTMAPPLTVVEAMSAGLPVVVSSVACMSPIAEDLGDGVVVPPRDPLALAQAIGHVLEDPQRWQDQSDRALEAVAQRWNWDRAAASIRDLYTKVLT